MEKSFEKKKHQDLTFHLSIGVDGERFLFGYVLAHSGSISSLHVLVELSYIFWNQ